MNWPKNWSDLHRRIVACQQCSRLRAHCVEISRVKRKAYRQETYWGRPVPGFGDPNAKIWIVGLAPGAHGANRTGRMFTGDRSGEWVYRVLHEFGYANLEKSFGRQDGMILQNVFISAAARCAPPDNKPTREELAHCETFLDEEFDLLKDRKLIVALGAIAFEAVLALLVRKGESLPSPRPKFGHGENYRIGSNIILCSYHPSQQNTQTGRLTWKMWSNIFRAASGLVAARVARPASASISNCGHPN